MTGFLISTLRLSHRLRLLEVLQLGGWTAEDGHVVRLGGGSAVTLPALCPRHGTIATEAVDPEGPLLGPMEDA